MASFSFRSMETSWHGDRLAAAESAVRDGCHHEPLKASSELSVARLPQLGKPSWGAWNILEGF